MTRIPAGALALLLLTGASPGLRSAAPESRRLWEISPFSWVRRAAAEKGAPANGQPLRVEAAALVQALGSVRVVVSGSLQESLFSLPETTSLGKALSEALAVAGPDEDLLLLSTSKRDAGLFGKSLGVTARAFVRDGRLNLIVQDGRLEFVDQYFRDFQMPRFDYGSRSKGGNAILKAPGAENPRPDWIVIPLDELVTPAPQPPAAAVPPKPVPAPVPAAAPAVVPVAIPAAQPKAPGKAAPSSPEARLQELKRLREKDLITEEEYRKRKEEILKEI